MNQSSADAARDSGRVRSAPKGLYRLHLVVVLMAAFCGFFFSWWALKENRMAIFSASFLASAALIAYSAWFFARKSNPGTHQHSNAN